MIAILKDYIKFGKYEDYIDDIPDSIVKKKVAHNDKRRLQYNSLVLF